MAVAPLDRIIYVTTNLVNGKIYVGQDSYNNPKYLGSGKFFKQAKAKYGDQNFHKEILHYCSSLEEFDEMEKYWIAKLDARNNEIGYNWHRGGKCQTTDILLWKQRKANGGSNNAMFGKTPYDVWLKKFGKEIADQKLNDFKLNISKGTKGTGVKPVLQYSKDGKTFIKEFSSLTEAHQETNINLGTISKTCTANLKPKDSSKRITKSTYYRAGEFIWKWKDLKDADKQKHQKGLNI